MKTSIIIVIAAVVVVVVAAGAYLALGNGGSSDDKLDVDVIKDTIAVGDYQKFDATLEVKEDKIESPSSEEFLAALYSNYSYLSKTGTEDVTYKGKAVTCDVYAMGDAEEGQMKLWVDPETGVTYKTSMISEALNITSVLIDTSFDVTKTVEDQTVAVDSFFKREISSKIVSQGIDFDLTGTALSTVTAINDGKCDVKTTQDLSAAAKAEFKVASVDGDTIAVEGGEEPFTKQHFLSFIDLENYKKQCQTEGMTLSEGQKEKLGEKTVATGKRNVTGQSFIGMHGDEKTELYVTYGDNGVLYSVEIKSGSSTTKMTLTGSSLISKA